MVFNDNRWNPDHNLTPKISVARPSDRFLSGAIDLALLLPVQALLTAPLSKQLLVQRILSEYYGGMVSVLFMGFLSALLAIIYQTVFWYLRGATLGQRFLQLRLASTNNNDLSLQQCLTRSLTFWLSWVLLAVPFLSMFSHKKRWCLHDLASETEVIAPALRSSSAPTETESLAIQSIHSFLLSLATSIVALMTSLFFLESFRTPMLNAALEKSGTLCPKVGEAREQISSTWKGVTRLESAMALFAADELDPSCLLSEAEYHLWVQKESKPSLAYLAMAIGKLDDTSVSNDYYNKVCSVDESSSSCRLSQIMKEFEFSRSDWKESEVAVNELDYPGQIWALRFANRMGQFERALAIIDQLYVIPEISQFIGRQRIQALLGLEKDDTARISMQVYAENLDFSDRLTSQAWFCYESLQQKCDSAPAECESFYNTVHKKLDSIDNEIVQLATYRYQECTGKEHSTELSPPLIRRLDLAIKEYRTNNDLSSLRQLAFEDEPTPTIWEARVLLSEWTKESKDLKKLTHMWTTSREVGRVWDRAGWALMSQWTQKQDYETAYGMAEMFQAQRSHKMHPVVPIMKKLAGKLSKKQKKTQLSLLKRTLKNRIPASVGR